jgi:cytochrome c oxidase subunit 2
VRLLGVLADTSPYWDQSPLHPQGPVGQRINTVYAPIFWVSVVVFFGVAATILYAALRFRRKSDDEEPVQVHGNNRLEVAWTLIPFALLIILFVITAVNMPFINDPSPPNALKVCVQGERFDWSYFYEDVCGSSHPGGLPDSRDYTPAKSTGVVTAHKLTVPTGRAVKLQLVSTDVNHSFYIPELAGQVNAIPGQKNEIWFQVDNPGVYHGACTELCGDGHAIMLIEIDALAPDAYYAWYAQKQSDAHKQAVAAANGSEGS